MSEETLTKFLERVNSDASFREGVHQDPEAALAEYDLGTARSNDEAQPSDEDGLRRMSSASVQEQARIWTWVKKTLSKVFCGPGGTRSWECPKQP